MYLLKKYAIIVAAGSGSRMGTAVAKPFLPLLGKPVLWYSVDTFLQAYDDLHIILVVATEYTATAKAIVASTISPQRVSITTGGETRFQSVRHGLAHVDSDAIVFVHDAVRCLLTTDLIHRCYEQTIAKGNAIAAVSAVDSIRIETGDGNKVVDRNTIRMIQTPQTFYSNTLKAAFAQEYQPAFTDEASVVEHFGEKIYLAEGEITNIKITRPVDLLIAEKIMEHR